MRDAVCAELCAVFVNLFFGQAGDSAVKVREASGDIGTGGKGKPLRGLFAASLYGGRFHQLFAFFHFLHLLFGSARKRRRKSAVCNCFLHTKTLFLKSSVRRHGRIFSQLSTGSCVHAATSFPEINCTTLGVRF